MIDGNSSYAERKEILDYFGEILIKSVRDNVLEMEMERAQCTSVNSAKQEKYKRLKNLSNEEKELVCDLLSETITNTLFGFMNMFERYRDKMELIIKKEGVRYDIVEISEVTGAELADDSEDGWIQMFSEIGRFI